MIGARIDRRRLLIAGSGLLLLPALAPASAPRDIERGIVSMAALVDRFAPDVLLPSRGQFIRGAAAARAALMPDPVATMPVAFRTAGGGVSASGMHAFTYGYVTAPGADGKAGCRKYVAYWIKQKGGWQIALFKRGGPAVDPGGAFVSLSATGAHPDAGPEDLVANEARFAGAAAKQGLTAAFRDFGSDRAVNMGGGTAFTHGAEAISREVGGSGGPAPRLDWGADAALVAPGGDLGVSWGTIRDLDAPPGQPGFPFFTVWIREDGRWRYIAE